MDDQPRSRFSRVLGFFVAVLSTAAALSGQAGNDLRVTLKPEIPPRTLIKAGLSVTYDVEVHNDGPSDAFDIQVMNHLPVEVSRLDPLNCGQEANASGSVHTMTCNILRLASGATRSFSATFIAPLTIGTLSMDASVGTSGFPDPDLSNNSTSLVFEVTDDSDLILHFSVLSRRVEPSTPVEYRFGVENRSFSPARGIRFQFRLPPGFSFESADFGAAGSCDENAGQITCTADRIPPMADGFTKTLPISVRARAPGSARGGYFPLAASISSDTPDYDASDNTAADSIQVYRHYEVLNVLDSGPGSLRDAIDASNSECDRDRVPCRIDFAIPPPVPETGWFTLRPRLPLSPVLATDLTIDGGTQTAATGDTNPVGPEIELSGELCESGNGLEIHSSGESLVAGLAINGFPENGVLVAGPFSTLHSIRDNYIGTDPTGTFAAPNRLRGITCFNGGLGQLDILRNVVSGNGKSGLFLAVGDFDVEGNRIGTQAAADAPRPNGASGIYFGKQDFGNQAPCAVVTGNVIAYNHDFGVASEYYRNVAIQRNSIKANALSGIDFGLDGETTGLSFDELGLLRAEPHPVLDSARYDEASATTVIQGRFQDSYLYKYGAVADLYASPGSDGQGEKWLGQATSGGAAFVLVYPGNLLGQYITATSTLNFYGGALAVQGGATVFCGDGLVHTTSEFSRPIPVTH